MRPSRAKDTSTCTKWCWVARASHALGPIRHSLKRLILYITQERGIISPFCCGARFAGPCPTGIALVTAASRDVVWGLQYAAEGPDCISLAMTDLGDDDKLASIADDIVVGLEASAAAVETQIRQGSDAAASESTRPVAVPMKAAMGGAGGPRMGENPKEDFKATPSYQETRKIASGSSGLCTGSSSAGAHHAGTTTSAESFGFAHPTSACLFPGVAAGML